MQRLGWTVAAFMALALVAEPATATPWYYGERQDPKTGERTAIAYSADIVVKEMIGFTCNGAELRAVASPPPDGASKSVKVSYEIDGAPFSDEWTVEGKRLIVTGDRAITFLGLILMAKGAIWFQIGGNEKKSLHYAEGLQEKIVRMREFCKPVS